MYGCRRFNPNTKLDSIQSKNRLDSECKNVDLSVKSMKIPDLSPASANQPRLSLPFSLLPHPLTPFRPLKMTLIKFLWYMFSHCHTYASIYLWLSNDVTFFHCEQKAHGIV